MEPANTEDRIDAALARIFGSNSHSGNQTITVNMGGVGVWICCTALAVVCALAGAGALFMGIQSSRQDSEIRDLRREVQVTKDYLAAIYAQAPSLKPEEDQDAR